MFVFAGASQFVAAGLVASGAGLAVIILTTFVVNLRHSLYAVSLAPYVKHLPQRWLLPLGFTLTDETFLVAVERYRQPDASPNKHWYQAGSAAFMYLNWQLCTWIGIAAGKSLPNPASWGLDFALVVTFIGMLIPGLRSRPMIACAIVAGATAVLSSGLPNRLGLMVATLAGVAAGMLVERAGQWSSGRRFDPGPGNGQMSSFEILMIIGMMAVTFGVRYPVLALVSRLSLPPARARCAQVHPACGADRHCRAGSAYARRPSEHWAG